MRYFQKMASSMIFLDSTLSFRGSGRKIILLDMVYLYLRKEYDMRETGQEETSPESMTRAHLI